MHLMHNKFQRPVGDLVVNKKGAAVGRTMRSVDESLLLQQRGPSKELGIGSGLPLPLSWCNDMGK